MASDWRLSGSYYEVCTCEAVCPCRANRSLRRATYDTCDFALSWRITEGRSGDLDLSALSVVLAGTYERDEPAPEGKKWPPWRVVLYIDEAAGTEQKDALTDIFLGRRGGTTLRNFAHAIDDVYAVRSARIALDHTLGAQQMSVGAYVSARTAKPAESETPVFCTIPGADEPGQEIVTEYFRMNDESLHSEVTGRCGFAKDFTYTSND